MTEPHVPDLLLERYRLHELPPEEAARFDALVRTSSDLRRRLEALDRSDEAIRREGLPRIHRGPAQSRSAAWWLIPAAVAVAAPLVIAVVTPQLQPNENDRVKGLRAALAVYRQTPSGSEAMADGAVAHGGDLLRVAYRAAGHAYGVIFSIDGRGGVTMHLPPSGDRAAPLKRDATVLLDQAFELDDAPLWERFYFITGNSPFAVTSVVEAVRRAAPLPRGLEQSTFSLQKELKK